MLNDRTLVWTRASESVSHSVVSWLFETPWMVVRHASLSMEFPKQEHWSGLPFPPPENLPHPGIKTSLPASQADSLPSELPGKNLTIKSECQRIDAFELWCWRRLLRVPWRTRRSNQSILKEIKPEYWKDWCWSSNTLTTWCEEPNH